MHDMDFDHEHAKMSDEDRAALARAIWEQETVELTTVGIEPLRRMRATTGRQT